MLSSSDLSSGRKAFPHAETGMRDALLMQAAGRWQAQRDEIMARHEEDVERAQEAHAQNVERLQQEWHVRKEEVRRGCCDC